MPSVLSPTAGFPLPTFLRPSHRTFESEYVIRPRVSCNLDKKKKKKKKRSYAFLVNFITVIFVIVWCQFVARFRNLALESLPCLLRLLRLKQGESARKRRETCTNKRDGRNSSALSTKASGRFLLWWDISHSRWQLASRVPEPPSDVECQADGRQYCPNRALLRSERRSLREWILNKGLLCVVGQQGWSYSRNKLTERLRMQAIISVLTS